MLKNNIGDIMNRYLKILIILFIFMCTLCVAAFGLSKHGSRGDEVTAIQIKLSSLGYYTGNIDGIYGSGTEDAVRRFQKDNGLQSDGIAGKNTLKALGIEGGGNSYQSSDYELLARLISAEARGESYIGQVAVGAVVLNRVEHPSFPDSVSGVIFQHGAFSCLYDGQWNAPITESAWSAARDALNGLDPSGGAIYYFNPATATSSWIWSRPAITTIGNHIFCE